MIPRIIHRLWIGGPEPEWSRPFADTWRLPGWTLKEWNNDNLSGLFPLRNQVVYDALPDILPPQNVGQVRSDFIRWELMERYGGVYVDSDFECLRPFDELLDGVDGFLAWEIPKKWINGAIIGFPSGHRFVTKVIASLPNSVIKYKRQSGIGKGNPSFIGGPRFLTPLVRQYGRGLTIFPHHLFYPYGFSEIDTHGVGETWNGAYAVHHWANMRSVRNIIPAADPVVSSDVPDFHVVLVCHTGYGQYLEQAVESVMANDGNYIVTIVDDVSTDNTRQVIRQLKKKYPGIKSIRNRMHKSLGTSRNCGIASRPSKYVVCLDADDYISPDYLRQAKRMLDKGYDVVNTDAILFGNKIGRWSSSSSIVTRDSLLKHNSLHCSAAFRRSRWEEVGGYPEDREYWEDYEFWLRIVDTGARFGTLPGDYFFYRRHGNGISQTVPVKEARVHIQKRYAPESRISVAIMAHPDRKSFVEELSSQLPNAQIVWDNKNDRWDTGRRALLAFDPEASHHLVLQDDAILCRDFFPTIQIAAQAAWPHPVSLYTGRVKPHPQKFSRLVQLAQRRDTTWIESAGPFWGVAIILPTKDILRIVDWGNSRRNVVAYDKKIASYYAARNISCRYTMPSLVEHRSMNENPSLIHSAHAKIEDRQAYAFQGDISALSLWWYSKPVKG